MRRVSLVLGLAALSLAAPMMAGCNEKPAAQAVEPVTEAQARAVLVEFGKALQSMDMVKLDEWYSDDIVAYDAGKAEMITGKVSMHIANALFADMKFDHVEMPDPKIQILGPDLFIASGLSHFTSSTGKVKEADIRYSEVMHRQADGAWKSVHEHIDFPPKE
jgi:ketosteroid isomerase-like protein